MTTFKIGDRDFEVPALTLGQLRKGALEKIREHDKLINDGKFFEALEIRGQLILMALRRKYPDVDEDFVFDNLDLANANPVWMAVVGAGGSGVEGAGNDAKTDPTTSGPSTGA